MTIEWSRIAKPQDDGYDSHVIATLLHDKYGWTKRPPTAALTMCDNTVAIVPDRFYPESHKNDGSNFWTTMEDMTPSYIQNIEHFLRPWEAGYHALQQFLDEFWPKWSADIDPRQRGCMCGHYEMKMGHTDPRTLGVFINAVYSSINDLQGCAEGIYHEVGHERLESIGIEIETHDGRLLLNRDDELYFSPIRRDVGRPMSAVIQAIYSWLMFTEADLQSAYRLTGMDIKEPTETPKMASANYIIGNLPKIEDGLVEIRAHARFTPEGKAFLDGFLEWGDDIVARSHALLREVYADEFTEKYEQAKRYREIKFN